MQAQHGAGRAARGVEPHGLARRRKRGVRQREPQRLADDLRSGRGAQKLAASAGRRAGAAAHLGGVFERDLVLREARADGLHLARVLARLRQQRDAAGNQHGGLSARRRQRHHHRGQALVAGGHAHDALAGGQRAHQAAQHDAASLRYGSESIMPVVPCVRPSQGSVQAPAKGVARSAFNSRAASATSRPTSQWPV
jgi:hypothetical protein